MAIHILSQVLLVTFYLWFVVEVAEVATNYPIFRTVVAHNSVIELFCLVTILRASIVLKMQ